MVSAPSKYPATEENTTLTERRILVISVKFLTSEFGLECVWVTDNLFVLF